MQRKPLVLIISFLIIGSVSQAQPAAVTPPPTVDQDVTPQSMDVATPDQVGDADPLDVLEPKKESTPVEPTVPQFTEIPEPGAEDKKQPPAPEIKSESTAEFTAPEPAPADPPRSKKSKKSAKKKKASTPVVINNDPDVRRETRFHNIYKKYNEQPTSDEAWEKASVARKSEIYKVQKGDTLWALSNTFFADSNYWPKIWSLNVGKISNPHEIDTRMSVQFFPGTMADAPTLGLVEKTTSDADVSAENPETPLTAANSGHAVIPKPKKRTPLLKQLPSSIPVYRYEPSPSVATLLDAPSLERHFASAPEYLSYYVANRFPDGLGKITETEIGMNTAADFQYVIVKLDSPLGGRKNFVAIKELNKVKDPNSIFKSANLIEVQGSIEIIEKVHDSKDLYRAIVKKSIQPIDVGAVLIPGPLPTFDPGPTALASDLSAMIIGGEYESERKQYQSNMIVFLNAGRFQGVKEGQSFAIYSNIRNRNEGSGARRNDRKVGIAKVIRVSDGFSTAYITDASDDIFIGDHIGTRNPGNSSENAIIDSNLEVSKALKSDLVAPVDSDGGTSGGAESSDFEL